MDYQDQRIECRYHITNDDYVALNRAKMKLPRSWTLRTYVVWVCITFFVVSIVYALSKATGDSFETIALFVLFGAIVGGSILYFFNPQLMAMLYYNSYRVDKTEQKSVFSPNDFSVEAKQFSGSFPWDGFIDIMRTDGHFVFWINPIQAHIIPLRALRDDEVETIWSFVESLPTARRVGIEA